MLTRRVAFVSVPPLTSTRRSTARPSAAVTPYCAKSSKSNSSRARKPKRAESQKRAPSGFTRANDAPPPPPPPSPPSSATTDDSTDEDGPAKPDNLKTPNAQGITLEHRLREEIQHPLRKPKQTLFATLTLSATLGLLFALGRFATEQDSLAFVAKNAAIDIVAISLFAYLTWREYQFGRRSLNSIAGRPQPRDLCASPSGSGKAKRRLSSFLGESDVLVAAGRRVDLERYFGRCDESAPDSTDAVLLALPVDVADNVNQLDASDSVLTADDETKADWIAWLGDAVPPRRNVALFRIERREDATLPASAYVVAADDPLSLPLPREARRPKVVDV